HGIWIVPVAILGAIIGLRRRDQTAILSVGWLLLIIDFSTTGILESLFGDLLAPAFRFDYPFSIAWHGPIIPYTILGGMGLFWLWERFAARRIGDAVYRYAPAIFGVLLVLALLAFVFNRQQREVSDGRVAFDGAFSSGADVEAMIWLKENTPPNARVLNQPGPHEGDWLPAIGEGDSVY